MLDLKAEEIATFVRRSLIISHKRAVWVSFVWSALVVSHERAVWVYFVWSVLILSHERAVRVGLFCVECIGSLS